MHSHLELYRRATAGDICAENEFDLKRFIPAVRRLVKEHGIVYDPTTPVPSDDDLIERVWQAARELFLEVGVYCLDTERIVMFTTDELDRALARAARPVVLGTGQQVATIPVRRPECAVPPFFSLGACGAGVTDDQLFMSLAQAYCELPYTDAIASPAITRIDGVPVVARSPLEVEGCLRSVVMTREAARRAGRDGLGISNMVPTGVSSQGNIAGSALAGGHGDLAEIGNIAEFKIDFDNLSRVAYARGMGRPVLGATGQVIGGYAGGPAGCAVALTAYHFFALLVLECHVQHPYVSHLSAQCCTTRDAIWLRSVALQAITRHSDVPCLESGTYAAGPATVQSLHEAAAMALPCVVSGGSVESGPTSRATHPDFLSPVEPLFAAEVGRAVVGMSRAQANDLVVALLERYEEGLADPPAGLRYQESFDVVSRRPGEAALAAYRQARRDLAELGVPFAAPPFWS